MSRAVLTDAEKAKMRELFLSGLPAATIAKRFSVSANLVSVTLRDLRAKRKQVS